ncbi:MAG: hypothetical protein ACTSQJ_10980 [Promethearchaeota archaeon]
MELIYKIKQLLKTRSFRIFLIGVVLYWIGFIFFILTIYPNKSLVPGENIIRDAIWIIYWRWNLDFLIIGGFFLVVITEIWIISHLKKRFSDDFLSIYFVPILIMGAAFFYMVAIDVGVTYFADVGFNGNWESQEKIFIGFTARELYHNFFFWYIPIVIITGITNQVFIRTESLSKTIRAFCICMAIYSLNLGLLDPIVCQILWGDWRLFGDWAMGGADPMFAEGWILHYIIFCVIWFIMDYFIKCFRIEIKHITQPTLRK